MKMGFSKAKAFLLFGLLLVVALFISSSSVSARQLAQSSTDITQQPPSRQSGFVHDQNGYGGDGPISYVPDLPPKENKQHKLTEEEEKEKEKEKPH